MRWTAPNDDSAAHSRIIVSRQEGKSCCDLIVLIWGVFYTRGKLSSMARMFVCSRCWNIRKEKGKTPPRPPVVSRIVQGADLMKMLLMLIAPNAKYAGRVSCIVFIMMLRHVCVLLIKRYACHVSHVMCFGVRQVVAVLWKR